MEYYTYGQQAPHHHQPSMLYSSGQSAISGTSPPGQMDTGGYLPPFLLGSPAAKSPSRLRGGNQMSAYSVQSLRKPHPSGPGSMIERCHLDGVGKMDTSGAGAKAMGGPPVHGLYDHHTLSPAKASTPVMRGSPERRQLNFSVVNSGARGVASTASSTLGSAARPRANSTPGNVGSLSTLSLKQRTPPSPPQMDPFYTQGDQLTSEDDYRDCWITVFGFPSTAASYILEQFSQYGTIIKHMVTSNGNWMHILYQSRLQAKKALSKNGKVFGNGIMVGVQLCIDKSIMEGYSEDQQSLSQTGGFLSSSATTGATPSTPGKRPTSIRPLTAAYQASANQHQVAPTNPNTPQKSSGFFAKAFEYMFGW